MDPIHVTRAEDGTLTVKRGQRRTLGAVKVGRPTVPVLVVSDDDSEAERITKQWHENERRDALTDTDRLAAIEQLTILGVPAGSIAKRLGAPKRVIDAAVQANTSEVAKTAASKHALTLTAAALVAEFEDDEQVVQDILAAVKYGDSAEHIAQRARDEKARRQAHDEVVAALTDAGVTVIDRPGYDKIIKNLRDIRLLNKDGSAKKKPPTPDEHAACPGHAAYVSPGYREPDTTEGQPARPLLLTGHHPPRPADRRRDDRRAEGRTPEAHREQQAVGLGDRAPCVALRGVPDPHQPPKGAETFLALAVAHGEHTEEYHRLYTALTGGSDHDPDWTANSTIAARTCARSHRPPGPHARRPLRSRRLRRRAPCQGRRLAERRYSRGAQCPMDAR